MTDLTTSYMGIPLASPLVVAASSISSMIDRVRLAEQAGAGALVIRSLFEEQIQVDALKMEENLRVGAESYAEASSYFPDIHPGAAKEHLHWIEKTRAAVKIPLIASLRAAAPDRSSMSCWNSSARCGARRNSRWRSSSVRSIPPSAMWPIP